MKQASGTHRPMGSKGGESAGLESGVAEVMKIKKETIAITESTGRPKPVKNGSIAMK